jgi:glycosyltransferase involved in cell wall biosynthesis
MRLILIDALIGNDYTLCLAESLYSENVHLTFIVPSNRILNIDNGIAVKKWLPSKAQDKGKLKKILNYFIFLFKTTALTLKKNKTVVHFQFLRFKTDIFYIIFLRILGIKIVYTAHNIFPHDSKKYDYILNYILYKSVNKIIIHSETTKINLLKLFKLPASKLDVIPHGNFDIYINPHPISRIEARQKFNLRENDKVLLFFGQIREYKGIDLLIEAFKIVLQNEENVFLIIAGGTVSQESTDEYMQLINTIENRNNVIAHFNFIPKEDVEFYFKTADFVVMPYKRIDHSGVVHLAYSFNKPIIATNVGDFPEVIIENKTGYLVNSQKPEDFAEKIIYAIKNMDLIEEMSKNISELNKNKFSWTAIARKTKELYESI